MSTIVPCARISAHLHVFAYCYILYMFMTFDMPILIQTLFYDICLWSSHLCAPFAPFSMPLLCLMLSYALFALIFAFLVVFDLPSQFWLHSCHIHSIISLVLVRWFRSCWHIISCTLCIYTLVPGNILGERPPHPLYHCILTANTLPEYYPSYYDLHLHFAFVLLCPYLHYQLCFHHIMAHFLYFLSHHTPSSSGSIYRTIDYTSHILQI